MYQQHPSEDVQRALLRLSEELCSWERGWERATGRQNLLVLIEQDPSRPAHRFEFVADGGKPIPDDSRVGLQPDEIVRTHCGLYDRLASDP